MTHPFTIRHSLPARTRIRWAGDAREPGVIEDLARQIGDLEGIDAADARPQTGSIVIHHYESDWQILQGRLVGELSIEFIDRPAKASGGGLDLFNRNVGRLDDSLQQFDIDLKSVSFLSLLLLSLLQASRGQWGPSAFSFLWYALTLASRSHRAAGGDNPAEVSPGPAGIRSI